MAERKLAWNKPGEGENIFRDEPQAETTKETVVSENEVTTTSKNSESKSNKRTIHRLTVDIYEDQFKQMSLRKIVDEAGTVTDQVREAIDLYLEGIEK